MLLVAISYTSSQSMTIYPFIFTVQLDFQWLAAFVCFRLLAFLYLPPCCSDPKSDRCVQVVLDSNPAYRLVTQGWFLAQWICQKMTLNSFCLEIQVEVYNLYSRNPRKSHDFSLTFRVLPPVVFFLVGRRLMVMLKCCRQNPASRISCVLFYTSYLVTGVDRNNPKDWTWFLYRLPCLKLTWVSASFQGRAVGFKKGNRL